MSDKIQLHDYQVDVVEEFRQALQSHKRIVVSCPTGSGKTIMALYGFVPLLPTPILWLTHRRELAEQVRRHDLPIDVCLVQSFKQSRDYASIIFDEAHHVCANEYRRIIRRFSKCTFIGLTATPYRLDGVGLGSCGFTKLINGPDIYALTMMGFLCPAKVFIPESESQGAWKPTAAATAILSRQFEKGIVYCRRVEDATALSGELSSRGIPSTAVSSEMTGDDRDDIHNAFSFGNTRILCNHTIYTEGYDVPSVDLVVLNRLTESRCLWRQMIGRGLRISHGKQICTILDLAGNAINHGSLYDREVLDLQGRVIETEPRELGPVDFQDEQFEYEYRAGEDLKIWKPQHMPTSLIENLRKLRSTSPLHRLLTA